LTATDYDIVVIGAGIHGVGISQAAAARGYSVLVLEQSHVAAGTSSRSSKLIHGGLRYLAQGHFSLVRECLRERAILLANAPSLVKLLPFHIPIYKHSRRHSWELRFGLSLYSLLNNTHSDTRYQRIPRSEWSQLDGLETKGLLSVWRYWDAQTDDQALTQAVMNSAMELGATLRCPATFHSAHLANDSIQLSYTCNDAIHECTATTLVNAAGPWVNHVIRHIFPVTSQLQIQLVQGTHILLDGQLKKGIYYIEAPSDKRPVFVMPWKEQIMVGTTELACDKNPDQVAPTVGEKTYLLEALSYYFPQFRSEETARIKSAFAGLRVLPLGQSSFGTLSRETQLHVDSPTQPRVLTVYGGKLTSYRATAEQVIAKLMPTLPPPNVKADTKQLPLKRGPLRHSMQ